MARLRQIYYFTLGHYKEIVIILKYICIKVAYVIWESIIMIFHEILGFFSDHRGVQG